MTYARVAVGACPQSPELQPIEAGIKGFLCDHVDALLKKAQNREASPPGRFRENDARDLFRKLHTGTDPEFLSSAYSLAKRLIDGMNGRTSEGLLVALRAETERDGRVAGLLKLQVVAPNGAILRKLESGELMLSAVQDMLEQPGALEKGALVASSLPDGEVFCADRLSAAARYFPEAFDIRVFAKPAAAVKIFFDAVHAIAGDLAPQVAEIWPTLRPGPVRDLLAELGQKIPDLTPELLAEITEMLEAAPRPVGGLDTRRVVRETYEIGGITLTGPIDEMQRNVRISERSDGGWQLTVDSSEKPESTRK